ncbi:MAG: methyl-accepting chemotaxis protein [Candidatus Korobacteraceae bacterium]
MMNLTNMRIGKRLTVGFGISVLLTVAMAATAWWGLAATSQAQKEALTFATKAVQTRTIAKEVSDIYLAIWHIATTKDQESRQEYKAALEKARESYRAAMADARAHARTEKGKQLMAQVDESLAAARELNVHVVDLAMAGKENEAITLFTETGSKQLKTIDEQLGQLCQWEEELANESATAADALGTKVRWILAAIVIGVVGLTVVFAILITRSISKPLAEGTAFLEHVSKGDISKDVTAEMLARKDEVGDLGRSVQTMAESLRKLLREISQGVQTVASSATQLTAASTQTASSVIAMSEKSSTVAAAAEESCATTTAVSTSMERASANLTSVAGATEEMSSTVAEIASNSEKARVISEKAMAQAQTISTIMSELGRAAQEIGKVTETITDISAQTNLLALNATIEAARAGTAGKGFAVVANEIKELAKQTSEATEDIKAKIAGVQNSTTGAVQTIETITGVIKEIGNTVASTAAAIEEQATVTKNVAGEIAQATSLVREVNDQVAQTASVSRSIASDIATVNSATAGIREGGEQVETSASELSRLSEQLKVLVAQFSV